MTIKVSSSNCDRTARLCLQQRHHQRSVLQALYVGNHWWTLTGFQHKLPVVWKVLAWQDVIMKMQHNSKEETTPGCFMMTSWQKWFLCYWPFMRGIHWLPMDSLTRVSDVGFRVFFDVSLNKRLKKKPSQVASDLRCLFTHWLWQKSLKCSMFCTSSVNPNNGISHPARLWNMKLNSSIK